MNIILRRMALALGLVAVLGVPLSFAAGMWSTLPVVGGSSFCASTVTGTGGLGGITGQGQGSTGSICGVTVPAGPPAITGVEIFPADTQLTGGAPPQTVAVPIGSLGYHINRLIGGDFGTNLWQRGTTPISATTATTATMTADRWWAYSSANTMTITKQTGAADTIPTLGFYASMRVNRPSATDVTPICVGQTLDKQASAPLIGNNAVFSFYALAGSTFSATASNLTVKVAYFTATDSAASQGTIQFAGGNSQTFALATTTGYANAVGGVSNGTTGSVASAIATVPISTAFTRYGVYAPIPATNAAGTAITGVGVALCYTPVGTGAATDWFEFTGAQLQALPNNATVSLPNGIISPTGFERRYPEVEQALQQAYSYVLTETAAITPFAPCASVDVTHTNCYLRFPVTMRVTPVLKYTAGFASPTSTTQATLGACSALATAATVTSATNDVAGALINCTATTIPAAGVASFLYNNNASGVISASAEP